MGLITRFRNRRKLDRLHRSPPEQGLKAFLENKLVEKGIIQPKQVFLPRRRLSILLNRYCNLNCYSCSALGMKPPRDETTLEEIKAFLTNMEGYQVNSTVLLTGGEPTAIDIRKLEKTCVLIHEHGHKTALQTNGFKLIPVEWIDYVVLNNHGVNEGDISKWKTHLKMANHKNYDLFDTKWHMDIPYSLEDNITKGARCGSWTISLTLWKDVVYPCCNLMHMAAWDGDIDQKLAPDLRKAGWNAYNPNLADTIRNWRETLPGEAYRVCMIKCWKHASKTRWVKIT